jgi:uncharacterized protein RhaS with RHS repeats
MRARYYDAEAGKFVSKDPLGFGGGDLNLYGYVAGNPLVGIDPSGLSGFDTAGSTPMISKESNFSEYFLDFVLYSAKKTRQLTEKIAPAPYESDPCKGACFSPDEGGPPVPELAAMAYNVFYDTATDNRESRYHAGSIKENTKKNFGTLKKAISSFNAEYGPAIRKGIIMGFENTNRILYGNPRPFNR